MDIAGTEVSGCWSEVESRESSTWRELGGTRLVLLSVVDNLSGKTVCHRTDNMNVENILKKGSPGPKLQYMLRPLLSTLSVGSTIFV